MEQEQEQTKDGTDGHEEPGNHAYHHDHGLKSDWEATEWLTKQQMKQKAQEPTRDKNLQRKDGMNPANEATETGG